MPTFGPALSQGDLGEQAGLGHTAGKLELRGVRHRAGHHQVGQQLPAQTALQLFIPFNHTRVIQNLDCLLQHRIPKQSTTQKYIQVTVIKGTKLGKDGDCENGTSPTTYQSPLAERSVR